MAGINIDQIIKFEQGELSDEATTALFQDGVDKGWVWKLQGAYARTARFLIATGQVTELSKDEVST